MDLGRIGVWWSGSWKAADASINVAAELEDLGYGALWSSGAFKPGLSKRFERLLASTKRIAVASGIVSIWAASPGSIAADVSELEAKYPERFVLGLGASHEPIVENYERPYSRMVEYLDALDDLDVSVRQDRRVLAALGPRMLELAANRAAGTHPYFVPVEHTSRARAILGAGPLLAPEVTVILESDSDKARHLARTFTSGYLALPNYANNLRSLGFSEGDVAGSGSDRLVDAIVAHGDVESIVARIRDHQQAGADHIAVQMLTTREEFPLSDYADLASLLFT